MEGQDILLHRCGHINGSAVRAGVDAVGVGEFFGHFTKPFAIVVEHIELAGIVKGFYSQTHQHKYQNQNGDDRFFEKLHDLLLPVIGGGHKR